MPQPFAVGDVVGGRYRITHHVVTSADQDIVFEGTDQVLNREVSILLASRSNAKQVATSAKELATGERVSDVQVLDLGLAEDRTYLIASLTDPNGLLDLVVPDAAPYVEPFFTDSLGSEIFGQSRVMEPETYHDDEEYYAALTEPEAETGKKRPARRRPGFLDRVSDTLNRRLGTSESRGARDAHAEAGAEAPQDADQVTEAAGADAESDRAGASETDPQSAESNSTVGETTDPETGSATDAATERAETEDAVSAGQEALEQRGTGIADAPQAPVAAYRETEMPEIPQPDLPERIDETEEPEEITGLPEDQGPEAHDDEPGRKPAQQPVQQEAQHAVEEPAEEPEEFSASAAGVSEVPSSRRPRRGRRPERTSGITAGIPALADLSLASAASASDT
ncbi:MAG: hypothetical protein Q4F53_04910, partial [Nesterenkonia sp.]|nr:hypothetical protein [Nesterenkonia sp.]